MEEFKAPDPLDEIVQRPVRMQLRQWLKVDAMAEALANAGKESPYTRRPVSGNDVMRSLVDSGIRMHEAANGEIRIARAEKATAAKKKAAPKKGRGT